MYVYIIIIQPPSFFQYHFWLPAISCLALGIWKKRYSISRSLHKQHGTRSSQPSSYAVLSTGLSPAPPAQPDPRAGPSRCTACRKRVGLTGFNCRCGNMFCSVHRYSDKHECAFDYRANGKDAIAKANPVVKVEKLDKIQGSWKKCFLFW
ncbi:hypothetical protein L1887_17936 [Cichorium endivia]|nr:hypothetical protein L1887_17936 [Cichorium endivia]